MGEKKDWPGLGKGRAVAQEGMWQHGVGQLWGSHAALLKPVPVPQTDSSPHYLQKLKPAKFGFSFNYGFI